MDGAKLHHQLGQERHRHTTIWWFSLLFTLRKIVKTYGFITLSLQMSCTLFLWTIWIMPGGWSQASLSTWTGTPLSYNNLTIFFAFYAGKNSENIWFYYLISTNELYSVLVDNPNHGLRTPREEIAFTARPKIHSHSQIFRYGRSIFCLPHPPNFSDNFDLCLHWVSVVRGLYFN